MTRRLKMLIVTFSIVALLVAAGVWLDRTIGDL